MFDFCPNCGQTLEQPQLAGQTLICARCGEDIGVVGEVQHAGAEFANTSATAAQCSICRRLVEVRPTENRKKFVPHYASESRKICPGSGKMVEDVNPLPLTGKDLSAYMTRDVHKVIFCPHDGKSRIEVLTLSYLDKSERVRVQIDALREMLGPNFRVQEYPASLNKSHLAVWGSADACVIAMKHERGGFQTIADAEIATVLADLQGRPDLFGV